MKFIHFISETWKDPRIPRRDRMVILILLALIISPLDFIPDFLGLIGITDDFVIIATLFDYFFNKLDSDVLLSHYPWGMKSFVPFRKTAQIIAGFSPNLINSRIWAYKPPIN